MKNFLLVVIIIIIASCRKDVLHFQQVEQLETYTTTHRFNKIFFINDSVGFVIGGLRFDSATILTTRDGGKTWENKNHSEAGKAIFGITQSPAGIIYTIGFDGTILSSDNEGDQWNFLHTRYEPYKDIAFINEDHGILIGGISFITGYIHHVDRNGNTLSWDSLSYELNDIEMINRSTGYLCGYGAVLKTIDSGNSWKLLNIKNDNFTSIHAYGNDEAWTCGYNGSIFHTIDGGNNWEQMRNGNDLTKPRYRLFDILFIDSQNGYAVGENGLLIYTDDGGKHWMEFDRFTDASLRNIYVKKDGTILVCGDNGSLYEVLKK